MGDGKGTKEKLYFVRDIKPNKNKRSRLEEGKRELMSYQSETRGCKVTMSSCYWRHNNYVTP